MMNAKLDEYVQDHKDALLKPHLFLIRIVGILKVPNQKTFVKTVFSYSTENGGRIP